MNKNDRKRLEGLLENATDLQMQVEEMAEAEQEKFDNMPEGLQDSDNGQAMQEAAEALDEAHTAAQECVDAIERAVGA